MKSDFESEVGQLRQRVTHDPVQLLAVVNAARRIATDKALIASGSAEIVRALVEQGAVVCTWSPAGWLRLPGEAEAVLEQLRTSIAHNPRTGGHYWLVHGAKLEAQLSLQLSARAMTRSSKARRSSVRAMA